MKKLIVFTLVLTVLAICFAQYNPYRIKEGGDGYAAKMVGVSGTRTAGVTVTEAYSSYYDLHQGLIAKTGFYDHWYDPNGGTTWNLDTYWDGGYAGKVLEGADFEYPWTVLMDDLTFDSTYSFTEDQRFESKIYPKSGDSNSLLDLGASRIHLREAGTVYVDMTDDLTESHDNVWKWLYSDDPGINVFEIDIPQQHVTASVSTTFEDSLVAEARIYPKAGDSNSWINLGASTIYLHESSDAEFTLTDESADIIDGVWTWATQGDPGTTVVKIDIPGDSLWVSNIIVSDSLVSESKIYPKTGNSNSWIDLGASTIYLHEDDTAELTITDSVSTVTNGKWKWETVGDPGTPLLIVDVPGDSVWASNAIIADSIKIGESGDWIRRVDWDSDSLYINLKGTWKAIKLTASNGP